MKQYTHRDREPTAPKREAHETVEEVTAALMASSRLFIAISARSLAATDPTLTLPQLRTLVVLHSRGAGKLAALAAALEVNASTALRMVDRLQAIGLVDRRINPTNRREVTLRLTPAGRHLVERVLAQRSKEIGAIVARLPADQRAGLIKALRALVEAAATMTDARQTAPIVV
ncbi:MarR family transcriptional regulator [Streptomyces sp. CT34]|uniref:MarR family winged helix-turn-helix transcriptional regulator n=1 Tax=Streptomyces sp. CT34 TaxID=1553907 RepID=UPI000689FC03|nr:MarR family transcriptional regulator [Streptomyces sp. CT34]